MTIIRHEPGKFLAGAVEANGLVFLSGQVPQELDAGIESQTEQVLARIDALLAKAGSDRAKILSATIWLTDIRNREAMNSVWMRWIDPKNPPARATVEAKLADPRMLIEIACVAAK